jgi:Prokaryotic E2 family E
MVPERVAEEVKELVARSVPVELSELNGQCYALVKAVKAPSPPWNKAQFDILIPIPAAYDSAGLDGFYVEWPCAYNNGEHKRIQGQYLDHLNRKWRLVSWHYPDDRPWVQGHDNIETHIEHCHGFFLHRGAVNEK